LAKQAFSLSRDKTHLAMDCSRQCSQQNRLRVA